MTKQKAEVGKVYRAQLAPKIRSIDEKNRTIEFVASTEAVDRMGDRIMVQGWDFSNYLHNPLFLFSHKSDQPPVGRCVSLTIETSPVPALVQKIQFADALTYPFADTIFRLYSGGFLNAVSVGFMPVADPQPIIDEKTGRMTGWIFNGQELLELSSVCLPANPEALARIMKSGIVSADDAKKVFAPENLLDTEQLAASVGKLETAIAKLEINIQEFVEKRTLAATRKAEPRETITINSVDELLAALTASGDEEKVIAVLEELFVVADKPFKSCVGED